MIMILYHLRYNNKIEKTSNKITYINTEITKL